jgi:hypothetical protein
MLVKAKLEGKNRREKGDQQGVDHQFNSKLIQHHGSDICPLGGFNYKHGKLGEI